MKFLENDQFETERLTYNGPYKQIISYSFSNDSLILDYGHYQRKYEKVKLDSAIFDPIHSYLKYDYDGETHENSSISSSVSAYASKISDTELSINGYGSNSGIKIKLEKFNGEGFYRPPSFNFELSEWGTDVFTTWIINSDSTSIGELRITRFDESKNICAGTFSFTNYSYSEDSSPYYLDIRNGVFVLPIYK